jgi:hypothetical protein
MNNQSGNISERWLIDADGQHVWTDVEELHIIEGDTIDLPVSLQSDKLERNLASFIRRVDDKIVESLFERVKLLPAPGKLYHLVRLEALEQGEYDLNLRLAPGSKKKLKITVHKGQYWKQSGTSREFILKNNCLLSSATNEDGVRIESVQGSVPEEVKRQDTNSSSAGTEINMKIHVTNFSKKTRVHLFATQFVPNNSKSLFK